MRQKFNRHLQNHDYRAQRQLDLDVKAMTLTPDGICSECGGDLKPRPSDPNSILGKYQPCQCNAGSETDEARGRLNRQVRAGNGGPDTHTAATLKEGEPMPETQLPTTESAAQPLLVPFQSELKELGTRLTELSQRPLTRMTVEDIKQWDTDAKAYLAKAPNSKLAEAVKGAFSAHRMLSAMFGLVKKPIEDGRAWASSQLSRWEQQRRAEADAERRKREQEALAQQEAQRKAEVAHLKEQGHKEEAKELANAPLPPVALPDEKEPAGKIQGVSVSEVYKLKEIVDAKLLAGYLVEHPEDLISLFEPKAGEWKRRQTSAKGKWIVPGVIFSKETETRNRG